MEPDSLQSLLPPFSKHLGIELLSAETDLVVAHLMITEEMCNRNGVLHGGAIMAFADTLGGVASVVNLDGNARTTTLESKTNFLRPVSIGSKLTGRCTPTHKGRKTMVWNTEIIREDGKLAAVTTQTQLTLEWTLPDQSAS